MVVAHHVLLLTRERARIAMFELATSPRYARKINTASEVAVSLPRDEDAKTSGTLRDGAGNDLVDGNGNALAWQTNLSKLALVQLAYFLEIYHGATRKASGVITRRDVGEELVSLRGYTEEILLERQVTPSQYGQVFQSLDLADAVRLVIDGWHVLQVSTGGDWGANVQRARVDLLTEPGQVLLAVDGNNTYRAQGEIVMRFDKGQVPNFKSWERVRWASDYDEVVKTTMAWQASNTIITDFTAGWSTEFVGGLPDTLGVVIGATDERYVYVRMTLTTEDTETPSDDDLSVAVFGFTPRVFALQMVARTHSGLSVGDIPASTGVTVRSIDADEATQLGVIRQMCEQAGYRFEVVNGAVSIMEVVT